MSKQQKVWTGVIVVIIILGLVYYFSRSNPAMMQGDQNAANTAATDANGTGATANTSVGTGSNTSAGASAGTKAPTYTKYTVAMGSSITIKGVTITPLAVEQDSRCSTGTVCTSAGIVRVNTKFTFNNFSETQTMVLGTEFTEDGVTATLIGVTPEKVGGQTIPQGQYGFILNVKN